MLKIASVLAVTLLLAVPTPGQKPENAETASADESVIHTIMLKSASEWNKGDLDSFATMYKNSSDTLFVANRVSHGYAGMLESYRKNYATPEARGTLTYTNLEIHRLDSHFATVVGNCHLERDSIAGGNFDCIFSLVFERTADGWKIILGHSSALPAARRPPAVN